MHRLLGDLRHGIRTLRSSYALTLVIIAVLAVGIGANVAIFTVVDAAFLRPLNMPEPDRLVQIQESPPSGGDMPVSYPNFLDWQKRARSFESMGIAGAFAETLRTAGANERVQVGYASEGFFRAIRVQPAAGRLLTAADNTRGAAPVAVLAHEFWRSHFAGDPSIVGRKLILDDQVWTIAGVASPLRWNRTVGVFVPVVFGEDKFGLNMREQHSNTGVLARLRPGVTLDEARAEMKVIAAQLAQEYPAANGLNTAIVIPLREYIGGDVRRTVLLMFGAVALLLLIACANVAGLLLARAAVRSREIAIRTALGATRPQLVRQLLVESLLLALAGAAAGIAVAAVSLGALERFFPVTANLGGIAIDARVLAFSLLTAIATTVLFGLAPALQLTRRDVAEAIKSGGRTSPGSAARQRTRKLLVVCQVALAVTLTVGVGLLVRSLIEALHAEPGFRPEQVVVAQLLPPDRKDMDLSRNAQSLRDIVGRLAAVSGVHAAGAVTELPFTGAESWSEFSRDDRPLPPAGQLPNAMHAAATPGYFRAMGIPLLRGRLFSPADGRMPSVKRDMPSVIAYLQSAELVAVVNQTMARRFWPNEDPIGKSFRFGPPSLNGPHVKIVGIVGDARQFGLDRPAEPQYFFSAEQFPVLESRLVIRTTRTAAALAPTLRKVAAEYEPDAVVPTVEAMPALIGRSLTGRENNVLLLGLFSAVALLLAAVGLYATMAYMVAQRMQEIGVRMALGAASSDVRTMVLSDGFRLAVAGVAAGILLALAGARVVSSMLYGVTATDALTYAGSAALLLGVMLVANYIPAWRASRVDPVAALRCD